MKKLLEKFMHLKQTNGVDILVYNEISLQLELGLYLRQNGYTVRFERNIGEYVEDTSDFVKKEIDIVAYKGENELEAEKIAIELKFPRNGQYPEQMFSFIKDIKFMEQVKNAVCKEGKFTETYVLTLVDNKNFYSSNRGKNKIYSYFRKNGVDIPKGEIIEKPTGNKEECKETIKQIKLNNQYKSEWKEPTAIWLDAKTELKKYRYYIIECK
ncbi:MAG: hypothetical protein J6U85_07040 [Bacteroidales bacterium]|nr:hypothetical protein [Bacteroidales bacterium]